MPRDLTCPECKASSLNGDKFAAYLSVRCMEVCDAKVEAAGLVFTTADFVDVEAADEYLIDCMSCHNVWKSKREYTVADDTSLLKAKVS
jgi:hypothetical protein